MAKQRSIKTHALDGGITLLFHISHHWPAASDVIRSVI